MTRKRPPRGAALPPAWPRQRGTDLLCLPPRDEVPSAEVCPRPWGGSKDPRKPRRGAALRTRRSASPFVWARSRSTSGMLSTPSIVRVSPPTSPMTRAAAPNAASDSAGPLTTNAPGPSPKRSSRPLTVAPSPEAMASLGQRDGDAALGDIVRGVDRARPDGLADRGVEGLELAEFNAGQRPGDGLTAQLGELGGGVGRRPARGDQRDRVARGGESEAAGAGPRPGAPRPGRRRASGRSAPRRPRCRARRCRPRPGCRRRGRRHPGPRPSG